MNETLKTIYNLKSTRTFLDREISKETLDEILNAGVRAANAGSLQQYSIIVVDDKELMKKYIGYKGDKALIFCSDHNRLTDLTDYLGYEYDPSNFSALIAGCSDALLAAQTAAIAAESMGVSTLFTNSVHRTNLDEFCQAFNIPQSNCYPLLTLVLGYSDEERDYQKGRLNGAGVIHYNKYERIAENEEAMKDIINRLDDKNEHLGLPFYNHDNEQFDGYLDWFHNHWFKIIADGNGDEETTMLKDARKVGYIK